MLRIEVEEPRREGTEKRIIPGGRETTSKLSKAGTYLGTLAGARRSHTVRMPTVGPNVKWPLGSFSLPQPIS